MQIHAGGSSGLVLRLRAEHCPLRCVAWQPDSLPDPSTSDAAAAGEIGSEAGSAAGGGSRAGGSEIQISNRRFLTASQWGDLKIWDPEDFHAPIFSRGFATAPATSVVWARDPGAVVATFGDGAVRVMFTSVAGIAGLARAHFRQLTTDLAGGCAGGARGGGSGGGEQQREGRAAKRVPRMAHSRKPSQRG